MPDFMRKFLPRHIQPGHLQPEQSTGWPRQLGAYAAVALLVPGGSVLALAALLAWAYRQMYPKQESPHE